MELNNSYQNMTLNSEFHCNRITVLATAAAYLHDKKVAINHAVTKCIQ